VKSGIIGLDDLIEGGFPRGFSYAILGGPGSGKTTFGAQFLYKGAEFYGENGIYVTFEEPPFSIANNMLRFNWNLYQLENQGKFTFVNASPIEREALGMPKARIIFRGGVLGTERFDVEGVIGAIAEAKRKVDAQRCVIDSISALVIQYERDFELRQRVLTLIKTLTEMDLTTLLLVESWEEGIGIQRMGIETFLSQGVIILHTFRIGDSNIKALEIKKMRGVKHVERLCPYKITNNGIEIYPQETVFRR
jgi:KaiC/GvpD/RAD55 family RecA-like ATPase